MTSKDQAVGWVIFLVCMIIAIGYLLGYTFFSCLRQWLIAIPVILAFLLVLAIGGWIGWTMATTPPPKPIEEIESDEEAQ